MKIALSLGTGLVALGASAATHYPHVATRMGVDLTVPDHADVAGAVGAAPDLVRQRVMISVTQPSEGRFRVHLPGGPQDLGVMEDACRRPGTLPARLPKSGQGRQVPTASPSTSPKMSVPRGGGKELFIEALIRATADGHAVRQAPQPAPPLIGY